MAKPAQDKQMLQDDAEPVAKKERRAVMVFDVLREDILSLRLAPGEALDEVKLAKRFNISRTPIREALFTLSGESLVTFLPNRTTVVTPHSMSNANDYFDTLILLSRAVVRAAAATRTEPDIVLLRSDLSELREAIKSTNTDAIEAADLKLRLHICDIARNFFYSRYYPSCIDFGRRMLRLHYYPTAQSGDHADYVDQLSSVVEAIASGNAEAADDSICKAINGLVEVIQKSLAPRGDGLIDFDKQANVKLVQG